MSYAPRHHAVDYIEFPASDMAASKKFFEKLFGWKFTDYGPEYMAFDDGRLNGGFFKCQDDERFQGSAALVVFFTKDIAKTEQAVLNLGGRITTPVFEFPGGRRFHFAGPDDIEYAVWAE